MKDFNYDLIVVGGGSGGVRLARWSGGLGAKVALVEEDRMGGTCVIRGCVPKKMMSLGSHFSEEIEIMQDFGWSVETAKINFSQFKMNRSQEIARLSGLYLEMLKNKGVDVLQGRGKLTDAHTVQVGETKITAKNICLATGGAPSRIPVTGAELAWVSDDVFEIEEIPKSLIVIGGGYIGVEFASVFNGFGSQVKLILRKKSVLNGFDQDLGEFLTREMANKGVQVCASRQIVSIERNKGQFSVLLEGGETIEAEECLLATGRLPKTQNLGLKEAGIETRPNGAIIVNDQYQTSVPHIFAIGDCTNRMNLTPVATAEGTILAESLFGKGPQKMDYENIPTAVFSHPTVATVGLSEEKAKSQFKSISVFKSEFRNLKMTLSSGGEKTLMKLVVDDESNRVVGCHMAGMDAPEIMQGVAIAIKAGATKSVFDSTIGIHPTSAEEFVTMRTPI